MISAFGVEHGSLAKYYNESRVATSAEKAAAIGKHPRLHPLKRRKPYAVFADDNGYRRTYAGRPGDDGMPTKILRPGQKGLLL